MAGQAFFVCWMDEKYAHIQSLFLSKYGQPLKVWMVARTKNQNQGRIGNQALFDPIHTWYIFAPPSEPCHRRPYMLSDM